MAYTYDDFLSAARSAGVMDRFTQSDLATAQKNPEYGISLTSLLKDIGSASTAEQQLLATEAANQLRKNYGVYSTGNTTSANSYASSYGSTIEDLMGKINDYGSYSYENQEAYQQLLDSIVNQQPFSYDAASDPSYSAYRKAYMREGDRASANALAQASAASGGRASSYAMTAAQQAGNYYAGQLGDILPTLEQQAYTRYLGDLNNRLSSLSALENDRTFDMQSWMNEYNMMQNSLGNYQNQDATDYQRYLDAQNQQTQADQLAYENALALYQTMGYATPEVAKVLGLSSGSSSGYSGSGYSGSSGSSGGGGGSGYDNGSLSKAQIRELQNALGVAADGLYGKNSRTAAGGLSAEEAYAKYVTGAAGQDAKTSGGRSVDMNSVLALGYGPIGEDRLAELVAAGEVEMYEEGNKIKFRKVKKAASGNPVYDPTKDLKTGGSSGNKPSGGSGNNSSGGGSGSRSSGGGNTKKNMFNTLN